jgi:50S ribosomal protein L16 3-hydroxylase
MQFGNFDTGAFLRDTWQRQPLLIRNPWTSWQNPLDGDELAGLACEEFVESRMIKQSRDHWQAEHGPFPEARLRKAGKRPWTLLVQAVDHHVPEVAALIEPFRFVPNWRIDDVMVSYASDGGGVGPHFDHYDVFLIQGLGQRRWQIGPVCDSATPLLQHDDLRLLAKFEPTHEWLLDPGDILYVPPGFAHNGVAVGDGCMTYSIGFRAPSSAELIAGWCDDLAAGMVDEDRYTDPGLAAQANPGEISAHAIAQLHTMVTEALSDRATFARWFGSYTTTRKYPDIEWQPEEPMVRADLQELLAQGMPLIRNPASRFSFIREETGDLLLFVDGECFECAGGFRVLAEQLCASDPLSLDAELAKSDEVAELIVQLFNRGSIGFEE